MILHLRSDVRVTDTEYGSVLLDERKGTYWSLNLTGTFVLHALLSGDLSEDVARRLTENYDVDPATAEADVSQVVIELRSAGLVLE